MDSVLALAVKYLTAQLLSYIGLAATIGMYCWAMWAHSWIAYITAATFGAVVFLPILWKGDRHAKADTPTG